MSDSKNLDVWNKVCQTDPAFTKSFTKPSGFKGTSINATYVTRMATEVFGPCGLGWGVTVEDEQIIDTNPIYNNNGAVIGQEKMHMVRINLWYELDGKRGNITHYGQTMLTFIGSNGVEVDEDAPKKSLTDATTKALSMLGFSADIFTGLYDDNKYVESIRDKFLAKANEQSKETKVAEEVAQNTVNKVKEESKAKAQQSEQAKTSDVVTNAKVTGGDSATMKSKMIASIDKITDQTAVKIAVTFVENSRLSKEDKEELMKMIKTKEASLGNEEKAPEITDFL